MMETFVKIEDAARAVFEYIGTDEYMKATENIDSGKNGFMGGLGMALCVIMARCKKYCGELPNKEEQT